MCLLQVMNGEGQYRLALLGFSRSLGFIIRSKKHSDAKTEQNYFWNPSKDTLVTHLTAPGIALKLHGDLSNILERRSILNCKFQTYNGIGEGGEGGSILPYIIIKLLDSYR